MLIINMETQNTYNKDIEQIKRDISLIKALLMPKIDDEGELSDWAKEELDKARKTPLCECISNEEVKKRMDKKWNGK
jgi:hypothetical protein